MLFSRFYVSQLTFDDPDAKPASIRTFHRAFKQVPDISLTRKKGNFSTCELCLTATDFLLKSRNAAQRELINCYRWKHLQKQQKQRESMAQTMASCEELDANGQPVKVCSHLCVFQYILIDNVLLYNRRLF